MRRTMYLFMRLRVCVCVCVCLFARRRSNPAVNTTCWLSSIRCAHSAPFLSGHGHACVQTHTHVRTHTHTQRTTTWTDCKWSRSGFLQRTRSGDKAAAWANQRNRCENHWMQAGKQEDAGEKKKRKSNDNGAMWFQGSQLEAEPTPRRPYRGKIKNVAWSEHEAANSAICCHFQSTINKGQWQHWRNNIYKELWPFYEQCSALTFVPRLSSLSLSPPLFFQSSICTSLMHKATCIHRALINNSQTHMSTFKTSKQILLSIAVVQ